MRRGNRKYLAGLVAISILSIARAQLIGPDMPGLLNDPIMQLPPLGQLHQPVTGQLPPVQLPPVQHIPTANPLPPELFPNPTPSTLQSPAAAPQAPKAPSTFLTINGTKIAASGSGFFGVNAWGFNDRVDWGELKDAQPIPDQYIVTLKSDVDAKNFRQIYESHHQRLRKRDESFTAGAFNYQPLPVQVKDHFNGIIATFDEQFVKALESDDRVVSVEPDYAVVLSSEENGQNAPEDTSFQNWDEVEAKVVEAKNTGLSFDPNKVNTWNLDRLDQRYLPLNGVANLFGYGRGVLVYVIDTGTNCYHRDLYGRCINGFSAYQGDHTDQNGHGSHVAGTVAGKVFGVGKEINIIAVRVLDQRGKGANSNLVQGIYWAANDAKQRGIRAVLNLSVGGKYSQALNQAVQYAISQGVVVVVAAGNERQDACQVSPSSVGSAIVVAATDVYDSIAAGFSNFGKCVDVFAPGKDIWSIGSGSNTSFRKMSGTSMAAPHVSALAAMFLSKNPAMPVARVEEAIIQSSTKNIVRGLSSQQQKSWFMNFFFSPGASPSDTPNRMAYGGVY